MSKLISSTVETGHSSSNKFFGVCSPESPLSFEFVVKGKGIKFKKWLSMKTVPRKMKSKFSKIFSRNTKSERYFMKNETINKTLLFYDDENIRERKTIHRFKLSSSSKYILRKKKGKSVMYVDNIEALEISSHLPDPSIKNNDDLKTTENKIHAIKNDDKNMIEKGGLKLTFLNPLDNNEFLSYLKEAGVKEGKRKNKKEELEEEEEEEEDESCKYISRGKLIKEWKPLDFLNYLKTSYVDQKFSISTYDYLSHAHPSHIDRITKENINGEKILSWEIKDINDFFFPDEDTENKISEENESKESKKPTRTIKLSKLRKRKVSKLFSEIIKSGVYDPTKNNVYKKIIRYMEKKKIPFNPLQVGKLQRLMSDSKLIERNIINQLYKLDEKTQNPNYLSSEIKDVIDKTNYFSIKVNVVEQLKGSHMKTFRKFLGRLLEVRDLSYSFSKKVVPHINNKNKKNKKHKNKNKNKSKEEEEEDEKDDEKFDSTEFGIFHTSLSVGNLQIEWVDSELVIVKDFSSEKVILSCDVVSNYMIENSEEFAKKLTNEILNWNSEYKYTNYSGKEHHLNHNHKKVANCQDFVQHILNTFEIEWSCAHRVKKYLNEMKYKGTCEKIFKFEKSFEKMFFSDYNHNHNHNNMELELEFLNDDNFNLKKREFRPKKHVHLDLFVNYCFRKCKDFERDFNDDFMLLKGFDRSFWAAFRSAKKKKKDDDHKNIMESEFAPAVRDHSKSWRVSGCPFTKPRKKIKK